MTAAMNSECEDTVLDNVTFDRMLVDLLPQLGRFSCRLVGETAEARDLVQETCRRAIESRSHFKAGTNGLAWLCRILHNACRDNRRRAHREVSLEGHSFEAKPSEPIALWRHVSDEEVLSALASLPDPYRATYQRQMVEGQPYEQIARELGVSPATVGVRLLRSRAKIRVFLELRLQTREEHETDVSSVSRRRIDARMRPEYALKQSRPRGVNARR
jgi:RNA polymerase sigma-70 factor (ECF subfamily)